LDADSLAQGVKIARRITRQMLQLRAPPESNPPPELVLPSHEPSGAAPTLPIEPWICPHCHHGQLIFIRTLPRNTPRQAMAP
jgi:hypothetical protein